MDPIYSSNPINNPTNISRTPNCPLYKAPAQFCFYPDSLTSPLAPLPMAMGCLAGCKKSLSWTDPLNHKKGFRQLFCKISLFGLPPAVLSYNISSWTWTSSWKWAPLPLKSTTKYTSFQTIRLSIPFINDPPFCSFYQQNRIWNEVSRALVLSTMMNGWWRDLIWKSSPWWHSYKTRPKRIVIWGNSDEKASDPGRQR